MGDYRVIMKYLFDFISKEKQAESLIEKLCHRFKATREVDQWRDLAYCLTLLSYSEKGLKKLTENYALYADKLGDELVYASFVAIINKMKKTIKADVAKIQVEDYEKRIMERHVKGASDDESTAKASKAAATQLSQTQTRRKRATVGAGRRGGGGRRAATHDSSGEDSVGDSDEKQQQPETRRRTTYQRHANSRKHKVVLSSSGGDDSKENDEVETSCLSPSATKGASQQQRSRRSLLNEHNSTPIGRKATPKNRRTRPLLRA